MGVIQADQDAILPTMEIKFASCMRKLLSAHTDTYRSAERTVNDNGMLPDSRFADTSSALIADRPTTHGQRVTSR